MRIALDGSLATELAFTCRRIFLKGFRHQSDTDSAGATGFPIADAEIYVLLVDTPSENDDIEQDVDYNLLRTTLMTAGPADNSYPARAVEAFLRDTRVRAAFVQLRVDPRRVVSLFGVQPD